MAADARRALLGGLIDYAGLFPPAQLPMDRAMAEYRAAREGEHAWLLHRFVCPAARLDELGDGGAWPVTVTVDLKDVDGVLAYSGPLRIDAVEVRLPEGATAQDVGAIGRPAETRCFVEIPPGDSTASLLDALGDVGLAAKVRCGGTAPAPSPSRLAAFIAECAARDLAWKATAGLHHPFRHLDPATGEYQHGFVNLLAAAGLAVAGAGVPVLTDVLADEDTDAFSLDPTGLEWRGHAIGAEARDLFDGYGSCSFGEPVADLIALGALASTTVGHG